MIGKKIKKYVPVRLPYQKIQGKALTAFFTNYSGYNLKKDEDFYQILDHICTQNNLHPLGNRWREVNLQTARDKIFYCFTTTLAYRSRLMQDKPAQAAVDKIVSSFAPAPTRCLITDCGLTDDTFTEGIVLANEKQLSLFSFTGED